MSQTTIEDYDSTDSEPRELEQSQKFPKRTCPFCGASCKKLPNHLRKHCEEKP